MVPMVRRGIAVRWLEEVADGVVEMHHRRTMDVIGEATGKKKIVVR
jgi:hypothetical protein